MKDVELLVGFGDARLDSALLATITELEARFPGEIAGCYVEGSQADRTAAAGSDLDLTLVASERAPENLAERAREIARRVGEPLGVEVDLDILRAEELASGLPPQLKLGSVHVYGEDIRDRFPLVPIDAWTRDRMHTSYWRVASLFGRPKVVKTPLDYPDPEGELFGYDARTIRLPDGRDVPSTRDLVRHTGWMATALVAALSGGYVARKRDVPSKYRDAIGDVWSDWLDEVQTTCRERWRYRVPDDARARARLGDLCGRTLEFERRFLATYRGYLLAELRSPSVEAQLAALRPLTHAPWLDAEVEQELRSILESTSDLVVHAAQEANEHYEQTLGLRRDDLAGKIGEGPRWPTRP